MAELIPTTGYDDDGKAQIFNLKPGEKLPKGWHSEPKPWHHPNHPDYGKGKASARRPAADDPINKPVRKKK